MTYIVARQRTVAKIWAYEQGISKEEWTWVLTGEEFRGRGRYAADEVVWLYQPGFGFNWKSYHDWLFRPLSRQSCLACSGETCKTSQKRHQKGAPYDDRP